MADSVRVEGARELASTMRRAGAELADMTAANSQVSAGLALAARSAAPKVTGRLAGSIRASRATGAAVVTAGGPGVPYAPPIHWGWAARNIPASLFLTRTAEQTEPVWTATYAAAVRRVVNRIHGK